MIRTSSRQVLDNLKILELLNCDSRKKVVVLDLPIVNRIGGTITGAEISGFMVPMGC